MFLLKRFPAENRLVDTREGEWEGGTNGESSMETFTPPNVK